VASVYGAVFLALAAIGVMASILIGVVRYYSNLSLEPPLLPTYGSVYISSASQDIVAVENRFGSAVNALLVLYVSNQAGEQTTISQWFKLLPGTNTIYVRGLANSRGYDSVDLGRSYLVIGNIRYPLVAGAGAPQPAQPPGSSTGASYSVDGMRVVDLGSSGQRFASLNFESNTVGVYRELSAWAGYYRSINNYNVKTYIVKDYSGTWCVYDTDSVDAGNPGCVKECPDPVTGELICCVYSCGSPDIHYCTYRNDTTTDAVPESRSWECATDQGMAGYSPTLYITSVSYSSSSVFRTLTLLGVVPQTETWDTALYTVPQLTNSSAKWPYIYQDQSVGWYQYEKKEFWVSFNSSSGTCYGSCSSSSYTALYCTQHNRLLEQRTYWGCANSWKSDRRDQKVAALDTYLGFRVLYAEYNITALPTDGAYLRLNITARYALQYWMVKWDPEDDIESAKLRIYLSDRVTLLLPRILGAVGIAYTDSLGGVSPKLTAYTESYRVDARSDAGSVNCWSWWCDPPVAVYASVSSDPGSISVSPVGLAASPSTSKTFSYSISGAKVTVTIYTPGDGWVVNRRWSDTIYITVNILVRVVPGISISATISR